MNTCGTCKFFGKKLMTICDESTDWDVIDGPYHACELLTLKRKDQKIPPPLAYAQDGSDYMACLCVKAEFGCAEWQPVTQEVKHE